MGMKETTATISTILETNDLPSSLYVSPCMKGWLKLPIFCIIVSPLATLLATRFSGENKLTYIATARILIVSPYAQHLLFFLHVIAFSAQHL